MVDFENNQRVNGKQMDMNYACSMKWFCVSVQDTLYKYVYTLK